MKQKLSLVTPAIEFINYRSSKNLIQLLSYLSSPECVIPDDIVKKLKATAGDPIVASHQSLFSFDDQLWSALSKTKFWIAWSELLDEEESLDEILASDSPISNESIKAVSDYVSAVADEDRAKLKIMEEFSQPLIYFGIINERLKNEKNFEPFIESSRNIGQLLATFILRKETKQEPWIPYLQNGSWEWIFPNVCMAYKAIINNIEITYSSPSSPKDEISLANRGEILQKSASESVALFSLLMMYWGAVLDIKSSKNSKTSFEGFLKSTTFINKDNPILNITEIAFSFPNKKISNPIQSKKMVESRLTFLNLFFGMVEMRRYIRPKTYEFIFKAVLEDKWEVEDTDVKELMSETLENVLSSWVDNKNPYKNEIINKFPIFIENINRLDVENYIKEIYNTGPSIEAALYILNEYNLELLDNEFLRDDLVNWTVEALQADFKNSGFPKKLNLVLKEHLPNDLFIGQHPKYYECISTLAINLASYDLLQGGFNDAAKEYYFTERFVAGANAILDAGYVDYALIFLGYGLLHLPLGNISQNCEQFSLSQVNAFITKNEVWPRVEKNFLPFLNILLNIDDKNISFENRLWIEEIKKRFQSADIHLLQPIKVIHLDEDLTSSFKIPEWFETKENSIKKSLEDFAKVFHRTKNPNKAQWQQSAQQNNLKAAVLDISSNLDDFVTTVFKPIHSQFLMNNEFKTRINSLSNRPFTEKQFLELGWIENLISSIQKSSKNMPKEYKIFLDTANSINTDLGKIIYKVSVAPEDVLSRFKQFRNIRNYLSHGSKMLGFSDSTFLFHYAICDFDEIYQLSK